MFFFHCISCYIDDVAAAPMMETLFRIIKCKVIDQYKDLKSWLTEIDNNSKMVDRELAFFFYNWFLEHA